MTSKFFSKRSRVRGQRKPVRGFQPIVEALENRCVPAALVVNTLFDNLTADTFLSFREAIALVNNTGDANAALGRSLTSEEQAQVSGPFTVDDTIEFSVTGEIVLTLGQFELQRDMGIFGPGANLLTIDADDGPRHFEIVSGVTVAISGLKLLGGGLGSGLGGSILNAGDLTLSAMDITGNGIGNGVGGGIYSNGTLNVRDSTVSGNSAQNGGGIFIYNGTIVNSTISGNAAADEGGGVYVVDEVTFRNVTITGNHANFDNETVGEIQGGGIFHQSPETIFIYNSIVAGNTEGPSDLSSDIGGQNVEAVSSHNLIGDAASSGGLTHDTNDNIVGVEGAGVLDINTILDTTLADNGGPTPTHALVASSPALDVGNNAAALDTDGATALEFDQRGDGFPRIFNSVVDIGAFEMQAAPEPLTAIVNSTADSNTRDTVLTLREAVALANGDLSVAALTAEESAQVTGDSGIGGSITFDASVTGAIDLTLGDLVLDQDVEITGPGADVLTLDAGGTSRVFNVGATVAIRGLTLTGGNGGAITNFGTLEVEAVEITGNSAAGGGGGIDNNENLTVIDSAIYGNNAGSTGGGIYNGGMLTVVNSTISGNSAVLQGGGIYNFTVDGAAISASTITGNDAGNSGGGLGGLGTFTLTSTIVAGNELTGGGVSDIDATVDSSSSFNLIGPGGAGGLSHGVNNNLVGVDPLLEPLALNGGPTRTHALSANSPAIDAGGPAGSQAADQRGEARPFDIPGAANVTDGRDIGAFELQVAPVVAEYIWVDSVNTLQIELGTGQSLTITESGGQVSFSVDVGILSSEAGNIAAGNNTGAITIAAADLVASVTIVNSLADGGVNNVTFSGDGALASGTFFVDLTLDETVFGTISFSGGFDLTGAMTLQTLRNIVVGAGSTLSTTSGDIVLSANQGETAASGSFAGININGGTLTTSGAGAIDLSGRGGDDAGGVQYGIFLQNGAIVESTSTATDAGTITMHGAGGNSAGNNIGVLIANENTLVTSVMGDIQIIGQGHGTTGNNYGVDIHDSATISSTGAVADAAKITLNGTGGAGSVGNAGVLLVTNALVTSISGAIHVIGQGGAGTVGTNIGVSFQGGARLTSTGTDDMAAPITIEGTGGAGANGLSAGIRLQSAETQIASVNGKIELIGTGGAGDAPAILFVSGDPGLITVTGTADVDLIGDSIDIAVDGAIDAADNTVTIKTENPLLGINIGGADTNGIELGLTDAELDRIAAGKIVIGDETAMSVISVTNVIEHAGDADFEVVTGRNISVNAGSSWTTTDGDLSFFANQGETATSGSFAGIDVNGATLTTTGTGDIMLSGRGGDTSNTNIGVRVTNGAVVESTAAGVDAGTITLNGTGGLSVGGNSGVAILSDVTRITSVSGAIQITGQGQGTASNNVGVQLSSALVSSTGLGADAATITLDGIGADGISSNVGVQFIEGHITSAIGAIEIIGRAGAGSGDLNHGVSIGGDSVITSTGTGSSAAAITIDGTGGAGAGGNTNQGIFVQHAGTHLESVDGLITLAGAAGAGASTAIDLRSGIVNAIMVTGAAGVSLIGDSMDIAADNAVAAGTNTVTLRELNDGTQINLGGADAPGVLGLTAAELERITAGALHIGDNDAGTISITDAITRSSATDIELASDEAIVFDGGSLNTAGGSLLLAPGTGGVQPLTAGTDVTASNVSFDSDLTINIDGTTVDTEYDQLNVDGPVDLAGVDLILTGGFSPSIGDTFTIVSTTGGVANEFDDLPEGGVFVFGGRVLQITYLANGGNDVVLTGIADPPASLVVDNLSDVFDGNFGSGQLTLREAITLANLQPDPNTVSFDAALFATPQTIELTSGRLQVTRSATITGPGAALLTIDAGGLSGHFRFHDEVTASLSGMTLSGGVDTDSAFGGSIHNDGVLTIADSFLTVNTASDDDGGAIYNDGIGTLIVVGSTVYNNFAGDDGGGIFSAGTLTVINSTFSRNAANGHGGAIDSRGTLTTRNVTVTLNQADSNNDSDGLGGGIYKSGASAATLYNTLVAGNSLGSGAANDLGIGISLSDPFTGNNNLIGDADSAGGLEDGTDGNLVGVDGVGVREINTILKTTLAFNGGTTPTHALVATAVAIDAGDIDSALDADLNPLTSDQRGAPFDRAFGGIVDIGAFEAQPTPIPLIVDATEDTSDGDYSAGNLSLREAIEIANGSTGTDTITFDATVFGTPQTITLNGSQLPIFSDDVIITGPGAELLTIDANEQSRHFEVRSQVTAELSRMTLSNGGAVFAGGSISNQVNATLLVSESVFDKNAAGQGGAIANFGSLSIAASTFNENYAEFGGGAIYSNSSKLAVSSSTFSDNTSDSHGAAIYIFGGAETALVESSQFTGNIAQGDGGAIASLAMMNVISSTFHDNHGVNGGAFHNTNILTISDSTFSENVAGNQGGGILNFSSLTIVNSTFSGNSAEREGGGAYLGGLATFRNVTVTGNHANTFDVDDVGFGGGIYLFSNNNILLHNTIVAGNIEGAVARPSDIHGQTLMPESSNNLIGDADSAGGLIDKSTDAAHANIVGVNGAGVRDIGTILDTNLTDNGGPTQTHALVAGSQALNKGDDAFAVDADDNPLAFDQRGDGFPRILGPRVDIGALESDIPPAIISDGSGLDAGIVDGPGTQHSSIREIVVNLDGPIAGLDDGDVFKRRNDKIDVGNIMLRLERLEGGLFWVYVRYEETSGQARLVLNFSLNGKVSLIDGNYVLHFAAGFDGQEDIEFHRLFGDVDGDHDVDSVDKAALDAAYGSRRGEEDFRSYLDILDNGLIDGGDRVQQNARYLRFVDQDGDPYRIGVYGPAFVETSLDDADGDGKGGLQQISISDTNPLKSHLLIFVSRGRGGDGLFAIRSITGSGLASLRAPKSILADGNIDLTGPLGKLHLYAVTDSSIRLPSVHEVAVRAFLNSSLFAGFAPDDADDPMAGGVFTPGGFVNTFWAGGIPGSRDAAFQNSTIAAEKIGKVDIKSVQPDNGGTVFGVTAKESLGSVKVLGPSFRYDDDEPTPQGIDDFEVFLGERN